MAKGDFVGEFELYVLLALAHLGDDAYGVTIRREIEGRTGREIAIGAVYATLSRLEDKGLVRFRISDPQPVQGGRSRKYFMLTAAGHRALRPSTGMLARMMAGWSPEKGGSRESPPRPRRRDWRWPCSARPPLPPNARSSSRIST